MLSWTMARLVDFAVVLELLHNLDIAVLRCKILRAYLVLAFVLRHLDTAQHDLIWCIALIVCTQVEHFLLKETSRATISKNP